MIPDREAGRADGAQGSPQSVVSGVRELLVQMYRLADDTRDWMAGVTPDSVVPALPPGRLAEYRISGAGGRDVSVWHASAGCLEQTGIVHDVDRVLGWVLEHEREAHADGS